MDDASTPVDPTGSKASRNGEPPGGAAATAADDLPIARAVAAQLAGVPAVPGAPKPDPILVVDGLAKRFGGVAAVDVAHLEIHRSSITAIIGPNGAGKSTLFNLLTGFLRFDSGHVAFDGRTISHLASHRVALHGMVRTFQLTKALGKMSVLDNVRLAAPSQRGERLGLALFEPAWRAQEQAITARADAIITRFGLAPVRDDYAATLSGGQRKLLELARALMAQPTMVLLDEPTAGVNPALVPELLAHIVELRDRGLTVAFVEHDMDVVMGISDWVVCMDQGRVIAEGTPPAVAANRAVLDAYLGTRRPSAATPPAPPTEP